MRRYASTRVAPLQVLHLLAAHYQSGLCQRAWTTTTARHQVPSGQDATWYCTCLQEGHGPWLESSRSWGEGWQLEGGVRYRGDPRQRNCGPRGGPSRAARADGCGSPRRATCAHTPGPTKTKTALRRTARPAPCGRADCWYVGSHLEATLKVPVPATSACPPLRETLPIGDHQGSLGPMLGATLLPTVPPTHV